VVRKTLSTFLLLIMTAAFLPHEAEAQRRAVRRVAPRSVVVVARPYYPVYYSPFYSPWYGWYGGWYAPGWYGWHPYGWYGQYYPRYGYRYDTTGAARIEVKPREAEVYVDGYLVGTVDDFDGWLQRLHMPYGEYEIAVYLPGHRTLREKVLFRPGATLKISGALEPLPAGSPDEPRPTPEPGTNAPGRRGYPPAGRRDYPAEERGRMGRQDQRGAENFGSVAVRVQPADAEVLIDGERWDAPSSGDRLVVQLPEGEHRIEIRRSGYTTYSTTIRVRRGETTPLNVSLTRQQEVD
jgi:hypothetical protein